MRATGRPPFRNHGVQRLPLHELHCQKVDAADLLDGVERDDVRMIERRGGAGFALEAREAIGVARKCLGQDLQGDVAMKIRIRRAIHPRPFRRRPGR
jgi:hypothetical protein